MTLDELYNISLDLKQRMEQKGYKNPTASFYINWFGSEVSLQVRPKDLADQDSKFFSGTRKNLPATLMEADAYVDSLPLVQDVAKAQFLKELEQIPAKAAQFGIDLPNLFRA